MDKPKLTLLRAWDFGKRTFLLHLSSMTQCFVEFLGYTSCKQRICTVVGNSVDSKMGASVEFGVMRNNDKTARGNSDTETRLRAAFAINFDASCMVSRIFPVVIVIL